MARIRALEQSQADSQQLRSDLLQTQTELAATCSELLKAQTELTAACSELAEFKGSVNKRFGEQTSHSIAREAAVKDGLQQQVNAEGSSLEHLSQRIRANNILHGVPDIAAHSRPAGHALCEQQVGHCKPSQRLTFPGFIPVHSGCQPHWQDWERQEGCPCGVLHPQSQG